MDNRAMIERLKLAGVSFDDGLCDQEFVEIETAFGFRFPAEIRSFFACGLPIGDCFFDWRDRSLANMEKFRSFYRSMENEFLFDIENNADSLRALLGDKFAEILRKESFAETVLSDLHRSTKLIPFYAHRCFFDGMDNMPIVSFWQPVDTIFYGETFEDYLEVEFLGKELCIDRIPEKMKETGIWYYLVG